MPTIGHLIYPYLIFTRQKVTASCWTVLLATSLLPDADIIISILATGSPWGLHRLFTHSLLFALLFLVAYGLLRRLELMFAFIGISSHILLDSLDAHGVPLLWPFSQQLFGLGLWASTDVRNLTIEGVLRPDSFIPDKILLAALLVYIIFQHTIWREKR